MVNDIHYDLQQRGYLAPRRELADLGHAAAITRGLRDGSLVRPVRGWVATRQAPQDAVIALVHRGVLTDASALRYLGVWAGTTSDIHVRLAPNMPGTRAKALAPIAGFGSTGSSGQVVRHWVTAQFENAGAYAWRDSAAEALLSFSRRESPEFTVAAIESALHTGALRPHDLPALISCLPRGLTRYVGLIDRRSEAGTETLARLRLAPLARRVDIQVRVGPHRLDILIDGWLNIEIDSEEWHGKERLENSRRDTWLVGRGYAVLRFDYQEVMYEWESCVAAVRETLRGANGGRPRPSHVVR